MQRRRLLNGGDVPESSDPKLLDLLPGEGGPGNVLPLDTSKRHEWNNGEVKNIRGQESVCVGGKVLLTNMWRNLRILLWVRMCRTFPDCGSMTGSLWILYLSKE